ncbi:MAG: WecB/TagA/CpsF family glycosyltransferase [Paeniclostridium sordellii]|nr:WecB/TagA/CpsF family glycosyltransferase [Paeniclostridium sordellii]
MNSVKIFDIPFTTFKKKDLIEEILKRVNKNEKTYIVTANAEIAMYAKQNKDYENIIKKANYIVPDGIGVVKGAKILNQYIPERIPGIELMVDLLEKANDNGYSVYFYGAREEVLNMMIKNLQVKFPKLNIIGYNHGYDNDDNNKVTNDIINLKPNFEILKSLKFKSDVKGIGVTCRGNEKYDFISRYFNPWAGINEDPVTGSVHTLLANYWSNKLNKMDMNAYQASNRSGEISLKLLENDRVRLSGEAVIVLRGELYL